MRKITADYVFIGNGEVLKNAAIILESDHSILDVVPTNTLDETDIEKHIGSITPGFVNAHCHLELSHMKGLIPTGTGLIPFIKGVISQRDFPLEVILQAIEEADKEMQTEGIVAVGDISNMPHTINTKLESPIEYCTFLECFDLLQEEGAEEQWNNFSLVYDQFIKSGLTKTRRVPHAPYSVSSRMFDFLRQVDDSELTTVSIHNQETPTENDLFIDKSGALLDFYNFVGLSLDKFLPTGKTSLEYALSQMRPDLRTLLVHNTISQGSDIDFAESWAHDLYWCSCPNANLYIENRLPLYSNFMEKGAKMCLGTDSLTSNWKLSILEEIRTVLKYQSHISLDTLIQWATFNGACALGLENEIGSIEKGKRPGLNLIDLDVTNGKIEDDARVVKIA